MDRGNSSASKITSDLLVEILSRVPPESFYRFKTVSKSWLALSSDPYYRKILPRPPTALICETFDTSSNAREIHYTKISNFAPTMDSPLGFLPSYDRVEILDHCNGIFLCSCCDYLSYTQCYFVCNPATKKWSSVTASKVEPGRLVLAFNPHISHHFHILNFHESINESENDAITDLEVFYSETRTWVQSPIEWKRDIELIGRIGSVFLNGLVYNLVKCNIMVIDPMGQSLELIPLPDLAISKTDFRIGKSRGSLLYTVKIGEEIIIWALDQVYEKKEWILNNRVNVADMFVSDNVFFFSRYPQLVGFDSEQDVIFFTAAKHSNDNKIFSYELSTGEMREICFLGSKREMSTFYYVPCYMDCLSE